MKAAHLRRLRERLGITQAEFAYLMTFSAVSVNRWENDVGKPDKLHTALYLLLDGALEVAESPRVLEHLRGAQSQAVEVIRALAYLES